MSKKTIWDYLKKNTSLPDVSIAGIMGNMEAESNCEACRVQGDFSADRSRSKDYANSVNNGSKTVYTFMHDAFGWGLCQWTYFSRKENLYKACKSYGVGIENEEAQLAFMLSEMQNEFSTMWRSLLSCTDIYTAAYLVCHNYERPAVENTQVRANLGQQIYNEFHGSEPEPVPDPSQDNISKAMELLLEAITLLKEAQHG